MTRRASYLLVIATTLLLVGCDHVTKHYARSQLRGEPPIALISGVLDLQYAENPGVAFSLLGDLPETFRRPLLVAIGLVVIAIMVVLWWRESRRNVPLALLSVAMALILGGALGNLLDRVVRGRVVDFIHITSWPIFNVADIFVGVGAALMVLASSRRGKHSQLSS